MTRLVFVHGRAQEGKDPAELQQFWEMSLRLGLEPQGLELPAGTRVDMPFYGDKLAEWVHEYSTADSSTVTVKGVAIAGIEQELAFTVEILQEVARRRGIPDTSLVAEVGEDLVTEKGIQNWETVLALLRLLDKVPGVGESSISIATHDVWLYLTEKPLNQRVQELVAPSFAKEAGEVIVVAHSLGSIVAYDALNALEDRSHVKGWVTVGSPLGIPSIYSRLPSFTLPRRAPFGVKSWLNARDPQDTVALYDIPATAYPGTPAVINHSGVKNQSDNQHGIGDYLGDRRVAETVLSMLTS